MKRIGRHLRNQWMGALSLFLVLAAGTAYAAEQWTSEDIVNNTIRSVDLRNEDVRSADVRDASRPGGGLTGAEIVDGSLNDEDVGSVTLVNFLATIGPLPAGNCFDQPVTGIPVKGDHVLLTPSRADADFALHYSALFDPGDDFFWIRTCNPRSSGTIDDGTTHFNALIIDAQ